MGKYTVLRIVGIYNSMFYKARYLHAWYNATACSSSVEQSVMTQDDHLGFGQKAHSIVHGASLIEIYLPPLSFY